MSESKGKRLPQQAAVQITPVTPPVSPVVLEAAEPIAALAPPAPQLLPPQRNPIAAPGAGSDPFAIFGATQAAFARSAGAVANEMTVLVRSGLANAAEAATAMLGAKTLIDAFEVNAGLARKSFDTMVAGSAKLSEIGVQFATESLHPLTTGRLGDAGTP